MRGKSGRTDIPQDLTEFYAIGRVSDKAAMNFKTVCAIA
jgi:hypothetical protein